MKNSLKKLLIAAVCCFAIVAGNAVAAPWQHQHQHHKIHRINRQIQHQQRQAARSWWHGDFWGAFFHASNAQQLANRKQRIHHNIRRSDRRWERKVIHCNHHHLYC